MNTSKMENIYQIVGETLMEMIPEEWTKIALYAWVDNGSGSVFFYYYPRGKTQPEYCHDIYKKWDMPRKEYERLYSKLFSLFVDLQNEFITQKQNKWTNLTLTLEDTGKLNIDYDYSDLEDSDAYVNHIIWRYKYLNLLPDSNRKRDVRIINDYLAKNNKDK